MQQSFIDLFKQYSWEQISEQIYACTSKEVEQALSKELLELNDFLALISPAARNYMGLMAEKSNALTLQRFGKTMQLFVPLYLSNECQNICNYCGFSMDVKIRRKTLTDSEIIKEAEAIKAMGFDHILLVTGEANTTVGVPYLLNAIKLLKPYFAQISIEVQPLEEEDYKQLVDAGVYAVLVYQETYHQAEYKVHHPKGKKSNFNYRLQTPDRIGAANANKIGVGVLLGLEDWRVDSFFTALHLQYLEKQYWKTKYAVSFPRLRPHAGGTEPKVIVTDKDLVQLICAYRLFMPDLEISISTREQESFRNNIIKLGATSFSAASRTNPGGYAVEPTSLEQFEISDHRTAQEVAQMLNENGYEPLWKDWDLSLQGIGY
ncbi:MAG: tyrosine lyase ThiH [Bacteroidota bacterium]|jgi:2-iminoacetate synthase